MLILMYSTYFFLFFFFFVVVVDFQVDFDVDNIQPRELVNLYGV